MQVLRHLCNESSVYLRQLGSWRVLDSASSQPKVGRPRRSVALAAAHPSCAPTWRADGWQAQKVGGPSSYSPRSPSSGPPSAASLWLVGPGGWWPEQLSSQVSFQLSPQCGERVVGWPGRVVAQADVIPGALPAVIPLRRAYGWLAEVIGGVISCPPRCPSRCPPSAASL